MRWEFEGKEVLAKLKRHWNLVVHVCLTQQDKDSLGQVRP